MAAQQRKVPQSRKHINGDLQEDEKDHGDVIFLILCIHTRVGSHGVTGIHPKKKKEVIFNVNK